MSEVFGLLFTGLVVAVVMILNGIIAHWVASRWCSERESRIAGVAFSAGGGLAGAFGPDFGDKGAMLVGALTGLAMLWLLFFKRETQNG